MLLDWANSTITYSIRLQGICLLQSVVNSGRVGPDRLEKQFYLEKVTSQSPKVAYVNNGTFEPSVQITMRKLRLQVLQTEVHTSSYIVIETKIRDDQGSKVLYIPCEINLRSTKCRIYHQKSAIMPAK